MFKGFTKCSKYIVNHLSVAEALQFSHKKILPEHVLIGLLKDANGIAYKIIEQFIDPVQFQLMLEDALKKTDNTQVFPTEASFNKYAEIIKFYNLSVTRNLSVRTYKILYSSIEESRLLAVEEIDSFVLFIACCKEEGSVTQNIMQRHKIAFDGLYNYYHNFAHHIIYYENEAYKQKEEKSMIYKDSIKEENIDHISYEKLRLRLEEKECHESDESMWGSLEKSEVDKSIIDLTEKMFHSENIIHGREKEIEHIFRTLLRKTKNNPLLIGEPGVGKTAIIEEVARRICWGEAPLPLLNARILQLDIAVLMAGTRFRGDFEERICKLLEKIQSYSKKAPTILFIDEFHHLIGAGVTANMTMDAAGILKPALARGELCCIGATTLDEYQKHIEKDKGLVRRINVISVEELSAEGTFFALKKGKSVYEKKHLVNFTDEALQEIIRLTQDYMLDRKLPDKAIDMLDEVGSFYRLEKVHAIPELTQLYHSMHKILKDSEEKIEVLTKKDNRDSVDTVYQESNTDKKIHDSLKYNISLEHGMQDKKQNTLSCAIYDENEKLYDIITRRSKLQNTLLTNSMAYVRKISAQDVREVISDITGVPTDRMDVNKNKATIIHTLTKELEENIIGQECARSALISSIRRSLVGIRNTKRAVGSFLFLGPTGVGKTHTAKQLAKALFGNEESLTRFDMSDFSEEHGISRLIGAPPGYVGYEEGGLLIKAVRSKPRQILLFDEIEKAGKKVFDMFLQILDDGMLQGQCGEIADFRHCMIIMTSNIGSSEIAKKVNFGFSIDKDKRENIKYIIHEELSQVFRPELINRFDDIIIYETFDEKNIRKVIDYMTSDLSKLLEEQNITISLHNSAKELLYSYYYDERYGARSIRRGIRIIEDKVADAILSESIEYGDIVLISGQEKHNKKDFVIKKKNIKNSLKKEHTEEALV